jgi:predicted MFS family arabinose efflux permease
MSRFYKVYKILRMKKELKEVYANQIIENFSYFMIGIFIPAFLLESGFGLAETVVFVIFQYFMYVPMTPVAARINAKIGVKHTILLRMPILIAYLFLILALPGMKFLYFPAALLGGTSLVLYWISINTEYVRMSDRRKEGEQAGLYLGLPYLSAVIGPIAGAAVLSVLGFTQLFLIAAVLLLVSVIPLFLSSDYKSDVFRMKEINFLMDKRRAFWFVVLGSIFTADFVVWGIYVFLNYGLVSLGIAASFMGLGMLLFTFAVGGRSNTIKGRRLTIRTGGVLCALLWLLRALANTELLVMALSFAGGFIIMLVSVSLFADFSYFAKKNGPARSVAFRQLWLGVGHFAPLAMLLPFLQFLGTSSWLQLVFLFMAGFSGTLIAFQKRL